MSDRTYEIFKCACFSIEVTIEKDQKVLTRFPGKIMTNRA